MPEKDKMIKYPINTSNYLYIKYLIITENGFPLAFFIDFPPQFPPPLRYFFSKQHSNGTYGSKVHAENGRKAISALFSRVRRLFQGYLSGEKNRLHSAQSPLYPGLIILILR